MEIARACRLGEIGHTIRVSTYFTKLPAAEGISTVFQNKEIP